MTFISKLYTSWSLKTPPFPRRLQIETTNRCNASCTMCPIRNMDRPKGVMDFGLLEKIAVELADQPPLRRIVMHIMGEPLLNPDFIPMVRRMREIAPHQPIEFSTNGSLLGQEQAEAVIETGVEKINFSLDALSPETHAKIRVGLNFDKIISNLHGFVNAVAASGKNKPEVLIQLIKMDINRNEWSRFADEWREMGRKHPFLTVYIKEQWSWGGYLESGQVEMEKAKGILALPCSYPFDQLDVYWDGRTGFCCLDENADLTIGDITHQSLAEIWQAKEIEDVRRKFKSLKFTGLRCDACGERLHYRSLTEIGGRPRKSMDRLLGRKTKA